VKMSSSLTGPAEMPSGALSERFLYSENKRLEATLGAIELDMTNGLEWRRVWSRNDELYVWDGQV